MRNVGQMCSRLFSCRAMMEENINTDCVSRMLETCIELDKLEYGKRLTERVKQEFGDVHLAWTPFHMRDTLSRYVQLQIQLRNCA